MRSRRWLNLSAAAVAAVAGLLNVVAASVRLSHGDAAGWGNVVAAVAMLCVLSPTNAYLWYVRGKAS